jgi:hypothetical protein
MRRQQEMVRLVRVEAPLGSSLGNFMSDMRIWFDHEGIQPMNFKSVTLEHGVAFDVDFRHLQHAELFRGAFPSQEHRRLGGDRDVPRSHRRLRFMHVMALISSKAHAVRMASEQTAAAPMISPGP